MLQLPTFTPKHYIMLIQVVLLSLVWSSVSYAQAETNVVYRFLNFPQSPRIAALGQHAVSLPDGDASVFTANPAYLNAESHQHLAVSYINQLSDISTTFASFAHHDSHLGTFAAALRFVNYGEFTRFSSTGVPEGSFGAYDFALTLGYGYQLLDQLSVGAHVDLVQSSYEQFRSSAVAFSAGALYKINDDQTSLGLTVHHFGRQLSTFDDTSEPLPLNIRLGLSHKLEHMPLRLTITLHNLHNWNMESPLDEEELGFTQQVLRHTSLGGELMFSKNLHFRLGYNFFMNNDLRTDSRIDFAGMAMGLLLRTKYVNFEFSRTSFSDLGPVTQLGLSTRLNHK